MATYKIIYREELCGVFYVEADTEETAVDEFWYQVNDGKIDFSAMEMISSSVHATIDDDGYYEKLWDELEDVPFDEDKDGRLILAVPWNGFPAQTRREDIWQWFDEGHSKGVYYLLYDRSRKTTPKNA